MSTKDFEKAIAGSGIDLLRMQLKELQVEACYGRVHDAETYVKWDANGRAFIFTQPEDQVVHITYDHLEFLDYDRDPKFDLVFD